MDNAPQTLSPEQLLVHARWVRHLALRLVSDPNIADDVVQETWIRAMERPPSGDVRSPSVRAWLARVVRSSVLQRFRGESRRSDRELLEARESSDSTSSEAELFAQIDSQRLLVEEVLVLSEPMRSTVILRYFKDLSAVEIARQQGVPAGTVRSRLSRALEELRSRLDARYEGNRSAWSVALAGSIGDAWRLLPSAPSGAAPAAATPTLTGSTVLKGALLMKVGTGLALALGIAAITVAGIAAFDSSEVSTPVQATSRVDAPALPPGSAEMAAPSEAIEQKRNVVEAPAHDPVQHKTAAAHAPESVPVDPAAKYAPSVLVARFTDLNGNPLGGVKWSPRDMQTGGPGDVAPVISDANGTARVALPMQADTRTVALLYQLEGYAPGMSELTARSGGETNAGTIELMYSVTITGRVLNEDQAPIVGAKVFVMPADQEDAPEDELLRIGPEESRVFGEPSVLSKLRHYYSQISREDGSFSLAAPLDESVRVYAKAEGTRFGWTEPIHLSSGDPVSNQDIVLTPLQDVDHIAGIVLSADGRPLPNFIVEFSFSDTNIVMSSSLLTDDTGTFDLVLHRAVPHSFRVEGNDLTPGMAAAPEVEPGTLDLVLQLAVQGGIELIVCDVEGEPISEFTLLTRTLFMNGSSAGRSSEHSAAEGVLNLAVPGESFAFEVQKRGYISQALGPYDSGTYPSSIRCVLEETPGISGRVVRGERPLAGARVRLLQLAPAGARYFVNGFPSRLGWFTPDETTSDEEGKFHLSAPADGRYIVHVQPPEGSGLAAVESDELEVSVTEALLGIRLEPVEAGELVVTVRVPAGRDRAGIIVGLTDGGLDSRTVRTDENGQVRFEGLRPGRWLVKESETELATSRKSSSSTTPEAGYVIPFNCDVRSGRVTEFELML